MSTVMLKQYIGSRTVDVESGELPDEVCLMATRLRLSCELLATGQVALYAQPRASSDDDDEMVEVAENEAGPRNPTAMLEKLIRRADTAMARSEG